MVSVDNKIIYIWEILIMKFDAGQTGPGNLHYNFNKLKENGLQVMTSSFEKMQDQSLTGKAIEGNA